MTKQRRGRISKCSVDGLAVEDKDAVFWDRDLKGFGVRVYPSGAKVYVVQTRVFGRSKRVTVGRHGKLSVPRIKAGQSTPLAEPSAAPTVADLPNAISASTWPCTANP